MRAAPLLLRVRSFLLVLLAALGLAALAPALCAAPRAQLSCPNCLHKGVLPCKLHLEVPPEEEQPTPENPIVYCSWAAACPECEGTLWVDCPRCDSGEMTKQIDERHRLIRTWLDSSQLTKKLGRAVPRLDTNRFALALDVVDLPGGDEKTKKKMSAHTIAHLLARDLEWTAARVAEHFQMTEQDYRAKMRMWLWPTLETHQKAQELFQGTLTTGDFKLLGRDPVFSVWIDPPNFDTVQKVRALFVHNAAHMLLSNAFRPDWIGDIGGGFLDSGIGHWYEYLRFGRTVNYCVEEASGAMNYEGGRWRAPVRRVLEKEKDPFLPGLIQKRTGQLAAQEHALCWSFYDYLLATHPGVVRKLVIDLKQKKPAREVLAEHLGTDLFATEDAWRAWVSDTYPLKGDEAKASDEKKGKKK
jgi:hypothetical protein